LTRLKETSMIVIFSVDRLYKTLLKWSSNGRRFDRRDDRYDSRSFRRDFGGGQDDRGPRRVDPGIDKYLTYFFFPHGCFILT